MSSTVSRLPALIVSLLVGCGSTQTPQSQQPRVRMHADDVAPTTTAPFDHWWNTALTSNRSRPAPGSDPATVDALERALAESQCDPTLLGQIRLFASALRSTDDHPPQLDPRLDALADVGPDECERLVDAQR